ncbi:hypothetical protein AMECASPLE_020553 [Ameca splendens]|uniref:Uncharacterized protein n=1 Tax=Ameca splendens TaxID=208324 RepID=A0ABV0YEM7_9TELE
MIFILLANVTSELLLKGLCFLPYMVGWSSRLEVIPFKEPRNARQFTSLNSSYNTTMTTTLHREKGRVISVKGKSRGYLICLMEVGLMWLLMQNNPLMLKGVDCGLFTRLHIVTDMLVHHAEKKTTFQEIKKAVFLEQFYQITGINISQRIKSCIKLI